MARNKTPELRPQPQQQRLTKTAMARIALRQVKRVRALIPSFITYKSDARRPLKRVSVLHHADLQVIKEGIKARTRFTCHPRANHNIDNS